MDLKTLRKDYEKIRQNNKLPTFDELNSDFEIDKIDRESANLLRTIRKIMMEKIVNSMSFMEMLINPVNAPRMYLPFIRTMSINDKKIIDNLYSTLADLSLDSLSLEIDSSQNDESALVNNVF